MQQNINKIPKEKKAYIMPQDEEDSFFLQSVKLVLHCIPKNRQIEIAIHWNYIYMLTISYFRNLVDINV